jgi:hypothetical protein
MAVDSDAAPVSQSVEPAGYAKRRHPMAGAAIVVLLITTGNVSVLVVLCASTYS